MSTVTAVNTRNQFRGTIVGINRGPVGLWLSSTRWIDRERYPLARPPQRQELGLDLARVQIL